MKFSASISYALYAASVAMAMPAVIKRATGTSYSGGLTATDVTDGKCAPLTFIFARGSTESGNMGSTVGPALAKALIASLGDSNVVVQGVDYDATIESNVSLGSDGGPTMAKLAEEALSNCPNTSIALSGYSQGAMVVHYAVKSAGLSASDVSSAVLYGDPLDGQSVGSLPSSKLKEYCASGDGVCETHTFDITAAHLSYTTGDDISGGSEFIISAAGLSSSVTSSASSSSSSSSSAFGSFF